MNLTHVIIAHPQRLTAQGLADCVSASNRGIEVCGVAVHVNEIFELLKTCPASILIYDPYLTGPGPQVICCRLRNEYPKLKVILMKNTNINGRFAEAEKCKPAAIIGCDALPSELINLILHVNRSNGKGSRLLHADWDVKFPTVAKKDKKHSAEKAIENDMQTQPATELLSQREEEVVQMIAKGFTAREIADVLSISVNTVRNHTQNILAKLGLKSKIEIISWYLTKND